MSSLVKALSTSIGRKYVMAVTGLFWTGFLVSHLAANLLMLLDDGGEAFNRYANALAALGKFLYLAEALLAVTLIVHIYNAVHVTLEKRAARVRRYQVTASAGGASRKTLASMSMIYTGLILGIFIPIHIWMFKFGAYYEITYGEDTMRDLKRVVVEAFEDPLKVGVYCVVMVLFGLHLRHAVWSAFQSLGLNNAKWLPIIEKSGFALAIALAAGFFVIPVGIFLGVGL